jgi:hypothetical protein
MPEETCDLSDLPVSQCACRLHGPKEEPDTSEPFPAKFYGSCQADCGKPIEKGDVIVRVDGCYAHMECV